MAVTVLIFALTAASAFAGDDLKKANALYEQRALTPTYGQALLEFERYYSKNKPDYEKAVFLSRAYFFYGKRYADANRKKARLNFNLGTKWAKVAVEIKPKGFRGQYLRDWCRLYAGTQGTKIKSNEAFIKAKKAFELLEQKYPDRALVYSSLGRMYRVSQDWPVGFRDYELSEKYLKKAIAFSPDTPQFLLEYAKTLIQVKSYSEARKKLHAIETLKGRPGQEVETQRTKSEAKKLLPTLRGKF
jgi:tetratricopeptide (TPR) repeat protein